MSLEDKVKQLYGLDAPDVLNAAAYRDLLRSQDVTLADGTRLRGLKYRNGARGLTLEDGQYDRPSEGGDFSTAFPAPSVRAASWDVELEMRVGEAVGDETMASRNSVLFGPSLDLVRHPYWGRTQDAYGEDVYHVGRMGTAFAAGVEQHVIACASHFVGGNVEFSRATLNVQLDEQTLREIYARPFDKAVNDGGVGCIMAGYNLVNGVKATQNRHLLTDVLRAPKANGGMGFRGFVVSDLWAMPGEQLLAEPADAQARATEALKAGLDVELPWALNYSQLTALVQSGILTNAELDTAAGRLLEQKFRFNAAYVDGPFGLGTPKTHLVSGSIAGNEAHLALAEEAAMKSAVLLSNGGSPSVLPIRDVQSIAVVGMEVSVQISDQTTFPKTGERLKLASQVNLGDRGSYRVDADPAKSIGPYEGIKEAAARLGITNVTTGESVEAAIAADFVVVVVGLNAGDEGEEYSTRNNNDRASLSLGASQEQFVDAVLSLGKPTVIVVESGSVVNLPWLAHANKRQATVWAGYGGQRVGAALGKLLFGEANFSGHLPFAWPREEALPPFTVGEGSSVRMDYLFGYREYDRRIAQGEAANLEFPFGWGMSYTQFKYGAPVAPCPTANERGFISVTVPVTNEGPVDGEATVMLFVSGPPTAARIQGQRPVRELKGFTKLSVPKAQTAQATVTLAIADLAHWEGGYDGSWVIDEGEYTLLLGPNDHELTARTTLSVHP
jgi:beta-glucosidase